MTDRAVSPVLATVLLVGLTVVLAGTLAASTLAFAPPEPATPVSVSVTADADSGRVAVTHRGGASLSVSTLRVRILVDDSPLRHQPPVPFFGATGFVGSPTGPFNVATDDTWHASETAAVTVASTNQPQLETGATVTVELYDGTHLVATASATA